MTDKPLGDWTLSKVKAECKKHADCSKCPFWQSEPFEYSACKLHGKPFAYKLDKEEKAN